MATNFSNIISMQPMRSAWNEGASLFFPWGGGGRGGGGVILSTVVGGGVPRQRVPKF